MVKMTGQIHAFRMSPPCVESKPWRLMIESERDLVAHQTQGRDLHADRGLESLADQIKDFSRPGNDVTEIRKIVQTRPALDHERLVFAFGVGRCIPLGKDDFGSAAANTKEHPLGAM